MPAYKDSKTGTWFVKFYCKDWTGENKQIKKRGFATKREALDYERNYKIRQENNLDMTFGEFWKLYTEDVKNYVKLNTWLTKEHIVDTKILPYFRKRFVVGGAKYTEDLKRFHRLQDEYLLLVNNDIKNVGELVDFISEQEEKIQQIEDRQKEIYRESSSRKRSIKTEAQYREYQIWHVEVQEELDKLKQEKRELKRQIQLADGIMKEDLYTAYYAVSEDEEIVADRDVEIPGMEKEAVSEKDVAVESETNAEVVNPENNQNEIGRQKEQTDSARKQQTDLDGIGIAEPHNSPDVNVTRVGESMTDVTDKNEFVEIRETEPVDKAGWIVRRISELGGYENVGDFVKADIFGFDIADVSGSIRMFSEVMKRLGINQDGDKLFEEFQRIYDESVGRDAGKDKAEDKMWNRGRGR